jgi:hypothetical protein
MEEVKRPSPSNLLTKDVTTAGTCSDQNHSYTSGCFADNCSLIKLSKGADSLSKLDQCNIYTCFRPKQQDIALLNIKTKHMKKESEQENHETGQYW